MKTKLILMCALMIFTLVAAAFAATTNPSPASPGYTPVVLPISGIYSSATGAGVVKFTAPAKYRIVSATANARAVSGTNPTLKVYLKSGAFTNFSGTVSAVGTPKALTAGTTTIIADEATVAVDLIAGGTAPKWRDLTIFILLKRL